ncbi:MAG: DNA-3-methyladenine glycosylase [Acidobacteriota bacterium]
MQSPERPESLPRAFFDRPTVTVARELLGHLVVRRHEDDGLLVGRIVETEAYTEDDPACHAWSFRTSDGTIRPGRGAALFGVPGTAYVYRSYGIHWMLNVVTEEDGVAGAVLVRALEPVTGAEAMRPRRPKARRSRDLTNGPGKLAEALAIDQRHHGLDLTSQEAAAALTLAHGATLPPERVGTTTRIGITRAVERPWRFVERDNRFVSRGRPSGGDMTE